MSASFILDERECCDLEMLLNGGFAPLKGFLTQKDYESVLDNCTLSDNSLWPMPIVLRRPQSEIEKKNIAIGDEIILYNDENVQMAKICVEDCYKVNLDREFKAIFGCSDSCHPYIEYVNSLLADPSDVEIFHIGGTVTKLQGIPHYDFLEYRMTPAELKLHFKENHWDTVIGFQTRNPMHKSHYALTKYAVKQAKLKNPSCDPKILIHPVVGVTQKCDVPYPVRVKCYQALLNQYDENQAKLSLLPLSMRMAGPREALWHALIRQNHGCFHFVVGRDHAGPSVNRFDGQTFFGTYDAHEMLARFSEHPDLRINIIKSKWLTYIPELEDYLPVDKVPEGMTSCHLSGTKLREKLITGEHIPDWFTFPEVVSQLRLYYPSAESQGFCLYFVGLSGSGKTTMAKAIIQRLKEVTNKKITLLDGDVIRENLAPLGFSKKDRSLNVRRIGYIAKTVVELGGICICANIAPYKEDREFNRKNIPNYFQIYVGTPLAVCEERDVKGLYQKARKGVIPQFTGISDPYEEPLQDEYDLKICCDNIEKMNPQIDNIIEKLREKLWIRK